MSLSPRAAWCSGLSRSVPAPRGRGRLGGACSPRAVCARFPCPWDAGPGEARLPHVVVAASLLSQELHVFPALLHRSALRGKVGGPRFLPPAQHPGAGSVLAAPIGVWCWFWSELPPRLLGAFTGGTPPRHWGTGPPPLSEAKGTRDLRQVPQILPPCSWGTMAHQ